MTKIESSLQKSALLRVTSIAGFVALTYLAGWTLFWAVRGIVEPYGAIVAALTLLTYLLSIPGFILIAKGSAKSRILRIAVGGISVAALLVLALITFGLLQDAISVRCTDLWGEKAEPCVEVVSFWLNYYSFFPILFVPATLLASITLAYGLAEEKRFSGNNSTKSKRR